MTLTQATVPERRGALQGGPDLRRLGDQLAVAAQRLHHLVVPGRRERRRRALLRSEELHLRQPDLPPGGVVSHHHHHGQLEPQRGIEVHAVEAERAVSLDDETGRSGCKSLAAMANGAPTPRQPRGPGSSQRPGLRRRMTLAAMATQLPPSATTCCRRLRAPPCPAPSRAGNGEWAPGRALEYRLPRRLGHLLLPQRREPLRGARLAAAARQRAAKGRCASRR